MLKVATAGMLALALVVGSASAQEIGVSGQLEASARTSAKEKLAFSRTALEEMQSTTRSVSKMLDAAEREGDVDKVTCLGARLASVRALLVVSERASGSMKEALGASKAGLAEHEFRKIAVAISKVRQFAAEAEACLGEGGAAPGTTELEVSDEGLSEEDDTLPLDDYFVVVGIDPPQVSPFE